MHGRIELMDAADTSRWAVSPKTLAEALSLRADPRWLVVAGGTDVYPAHVGRSIARPILDLSAIDTLRTIERRTDPGGRAWIRIGAGVRWSALRDSFTSSGLQALAQAAAEVGGLQIQNRGTLGGNLCNASPAADGVPALLALGAEVELVSARGTRRLPLSEFMLGSRRTALEADELMRAIEVPEPALDSASCFLKLGHRRYLVISIVMVAAQIELDAQRSIASCRVAVGSCSAVARRLTSIEAALTGLRLNDARQAVDRLFGPAAAGRSDVLDGLTPIDDVRGTAAFRREAAGELVRRALCTTIAARSAN